MARGYGLHIGLAHIDAGVHGTSKPAAGCDDAAVAIHNIAVLAGYSQTTLLVNEDATRFRVMQAFTEIADQVEPGDIVLVSLAGHGIEHVGTGIADERRDQAFLLFDGILVDDEVYDLLKLIVVPARVVIVAEACFSGSLAEAPAPDVIAAASADDTSADVEWFLDDATAHLTEVSATFRRSYGGWREHAKTFPATRPKVTANVLLLAAAADTTVALGLPEGAAGVPPFTEALLACLAGATDYVDLHALISALAIQKSVFAVPVLNVNLVNDASFVQQRPFSI